MLLKKLKLENIRSYISQEVNFPEGATLLSGDIGSGKSTILLAIDFALFGLQKGSLSGNALLRNGEKKGSVELHFSIENKEVIIKRTLSRTKTSVTQDSGYIFINGEKKEATAVELKQHILNILNYPRELLTKSKSLIYKYTVYTPQEEMKTILTGDPDLRLDTLRKVFGIDKYKRVKENSKIIISEIKAKKKEIEGFISDLETKQTEQSQKQEELKIQEKKLQEIKPKLEELKAKLKLKKETLAEIETKIQKLNKLKQDLEIAKTNIQNKLLTKETLSKQLSDIKTQIAEIKTETLQEFDESLIQQKENQLQKLEAEIQEKNLLLQRLKTQIEHHQTTVSNITQYDRCPTCQQQVSREYKKDIASKANEKINELTKETESIRIEQAKNQTVNKKLKQEIDKLKSTKQKLEIDKIKIKSKEEKIQQQTKLMQELDSTNLQIQKFNNQKLELEKQLANFKDLDTTYTTAKQELENLQQQERKVDIEKAEIDQDIKAKEDIIKLLQYEIQLKLNKRANLEKLKKLQYWIEEHFLNLMDVMERNIMFKVHSDFNNLFEKWFSILIDNEILKIKLSSDFTPQIEQNGYDIDYSHLSGGEKTAAALAYRLALNQVINNLLVEIKTNDLIILDEPTDGFSTEQLDRMRLVLDELNIAQILIVSHDPKIESFVQNVLKLNKEAHISKLS